MGVISLSTREKCVTGGARRLMKALSRVRLAGLGAFIALSLSACVSVMSEQECQIADWTSLGRQDGANGLSLEKFNQRTAQCGKFNIPPDAAAYNAGREQGLNLYCTPQNGFQQGAAGRRYQGVCLGRNEGAFLQEYGLGKELYRLRSSYDYAVREYDNAVSSIRSDRYDIKRLRNKRQDPNLTDEERDKIRRRIRRLRDSIRYNEDRLSYLSRQISRTLYQLERFQSSLNARRYSLPY